MNRREFITSGLAAGVALSHLLRARPAQGQSRNRAAVVIGVDKCGNLPTLRAAASGARSVAGWLGNDGFVVRPFIDDTGPVRASAIFDAVNELVDKGTFDQLVVYFSGHGFLSSYRELWMLSGAPQNPNEAVSLNESIRLARRSGIPSVVFISDACRSTPQSLQASHVTGSLIFPSPSRPSRVQPEIDQFLACLEGDPAYEVAVTEAVGAYEGIFTETLLDAFRRPEPTTIWTAPDGSSVIPNRKLKSFLMERVPRNAQARSIKLNQQPHAIIESGDQVYIARAHFPVSTGAGSGGAVSGGGPGGGAFGAPTITGRPQPAPLPPPAASAPRPSMPAPPPGAQPAPPPFPERAPAAPLSIPEAVERELAAPQPGLVPPRVGGRFDQARDSILNAKAPAQFETETGFSVNGARVVEVLAAGRPGAAILDPGRPLDPGIIRIPRGPTNGASTLIRFDDGRGMIVAALTGFVGTIVVEDGRVTNVSYVPSRNNHRWGEYVASRERLDQLRAFVATAARFGSFRFGGDTRSKENSAQSFADRIRVFKGVDPTLGLYAAYAYSEAGIQDDVRSVQGFMQDDLEINVFDVAMLAGALSERNLRSVERLYPFCPMLSQGWGLLRLLNVNLSDSVQRARNFLRPALWTTFEKEGVDILAAAIRTGELR